MDEGHREQLQQGSDFPKISTSLSWVVLFLFLQLLGFGLAVGIAAHIEGSGRDPMQLMNDLAFRAPPAIASLAGSSLLMLALLALYLRKQGRAARIGLMTGSRIGLPRTIGLAVALIAGGVAFQFVYANYVIPDIQSQAEMRKLFAALPKTALNQGMLFLAVAVFAPVLEELLFRGMLQTALAQRLPAWAAILVAALVFALIHMQPFAIPALMVMGAVFGILYHVTGSLRVTILAHAINNAAALLLS
jgi:membrane protease YdiL (CAAX protease family)